jgi:hypothetical protein
MDAPGGRGDPDSGGVDPAAAFFGLWPRIAETTEPVPGVRPLQPQSRPVVEQLRRLRIA